MIYFMCDLLTPTSSTTAVVTIAQTHCCWVSTHRCWVSTAFEDMVSFRASLTVFVLRATPTTWRAAHVQVCCADIIHHTLASLLCYTPSSYATWYSSVASSVLPAYLAGALFCKLVTAPTRTSQKVLVAVNSTSTGKNVAESHAGTTNSMLPVALVLSMISMVHSRALRRGSYRHCPSTCTMSVHNNNIIFAAIHEYYDYYMHEKPLYVLHVHASPCSSPTPG